MRRRVRAVHAGRALVRGVGRDRFPGPELADWAVVREELRRGDEVQQPEYEVGTGMRCVFGRQLKLFRERAGMDRARLGSLTGYSAPTIASFEQARRIPPPKFIDRADEVLQAGEVLSASKEEVTRAQYPAFFRGAAKLAAEAVVLHVYAPRLCQDSCGPRRTRGRCSPCDDRSWMTRSSSSGWPLDRHGRRSPPEARRLGCRVPRRRWLPWRSTSAQRSSVREAVAFPGDDRHREGPGPHATVARMTRRQRS